MAIDSKTISELRALTGAGIVDCKKCLEDVAKIQKLTEGLKADLEKSDPHVLNTSFLKTTEEIEKLAKKVRSRLRRF